MSVKTPTTLPPDELDLLEPPVQHHAPPPEMKPPTRKPKKKSSWLSWIIALAVIAGIGYFIHKRSQDTATAAAPKGGRGDTGPTPVLLGTVRVGEIPVYLNGLGTVTAFNTVTVKSRVDGQLESIGFQEGQFVKQGDLIAQIDPRPFQVQLAQAEGQLARDQSQLNNAKLDLARFQELFNQGVVSKQQLDTQAALVGQNSGTIKADEAAVANANLQLTYSKIMAPISGRIGLKLVDVGNMIHATDPTGLVVITQINPIAVLFTIPEDNINEVARRLRSGEHLACDAFDRSGQTKLASGRLETIDNQIDQSSGTERLKAVFNNADNKLFPNQFVNIRMLVQVKKNQILAPAAAIQRGPQGTYVYAVKPDDTVEIKVVKVGTIEGGDASIEAGLTGNEKVVVDGVDKLRAGSKIQVAPGQGKGGGGSGGGQAAGAGGADAKGNNPDSAKSDNPKSGDAASSGSGGQGRGSKARSGGQ